MVQSAGADASPLSWKNGAGASARSASLRSDDVTCQARKVARQEEGGAGGQPMRHAERGHADQQQARAGEGGEEDDEDDEDSDEMGSGGTVAGPGGDGGEEQGGGQAGEDDVQIELTMTIDQGLTALTDRRDGLMQKISDMKDVGLQHIEELKQGFVQSMNRLAQQVVSDCDETASQWTELSKQTRQAEQRLRIARSLMDGLGHGRLE
ncbi:hypothetical protein FOA52_009576 [Chlamydomonas sp. UWO 241]|nr:hypothetical protein FOA52_009576 [Chlamydomonas sp. UWO 241]